MLVAPDRYSGTLTAVEAARALSQGWGEGAPGDEVVAVPMSDGSAGLLEVVAAVRGGELVPATVTGPLGASVPAAVLHVPGPGGGTAYVEAEQVLGTQLVPAADRLTAATSGTSAGLGELLGVAVRSGAGRVVVGLGPAVVHDGGAGLLAALAAAGGAVGAGPDAGSRRAAAGADAGGGPLLTGGLGLGELTDADAAVVRPAAAALEGVDVVLALAEDAPLLGLHGAGAVLGQDPAVGAEVAQRLERALGNATARLERAAPERRPTLALAAAAPGAHRHGGAGRLARQDGTGAGGGAAFALRLLGARALAGADVVADAVGLAAHVERADLVLTGGRVLDAASLTGSVIATVGRLGMARGLPVVVVAEEVHTSRREVAQIGVSGTYEVLTRRRDGSVVPPAAPGAGAQLAERARRVARTWSP
ncbi:glycerate kinase [Georgenia sp. AZ-5]|uniref:glycerate kinase n=1 Tax=Georgenia sp. AZ-5 TaxID=3367526 RepID=UPI003754D14D